MMLICATILAAQGYVFTDLGTLGNANHESFTGGINNRGHVAGESEIPAPQGSGARHAWFHDGVQLIDIPPIVPNIGFGNDLDDHDRVVGYSSAGSVKIHAFRWGNGVTTDLHLNFPLSFSRLNGINSHGDMVGTYSLFVAGQMVSQYHAYLMDDGGSWQDLGTLGGLQSQARAIDDRGRVVGFSHDSNGYARAFLWTPSGGLQDLGDLGGVRADAEDIAMTGTVVGASLDANGNYRPFRWDNGVMSDLGTLGGVSGRAKGINELDQIVGSALDASGVKHAVLWSAGSVIDLDAFAPAGGAWVLTGAHDINELGEICGTGTLNGVKRPYKLTPISSAPRITPPLPAIAGGHARVFANGFAPGGLVHLGGAAATSMTPLPNCVGFHELMQPVVLGIGTADAQGRLEWSLNVPPFLSGRTVMVQAAQLSTCSVSELVSVTFL